jgi:hypothetical protein
MYSGECYRCQANNELLCSDIWRQAQREISYIRVFCVMNSCCNIIYINTNDITCTSRTLNCCGFCGDRHCCEDVSLGRQDSCRRALCRRSCCQRYSGRRGHHTGKHGANWTRREFHKCMVFYWNMDRFNAHDLLSRGWPNTFNSVVSPILCILS